MVSDTTQDNGLINNSKSDTEYIRRQIEELRSLENRLEEKLDRLEEERNGKSLDEAKRVELVETLMRETGLDRADLLDTESPSNAGLRNSGYRKVIEHVFELQDRIRKLEEEVSGEEKT